MVVNVIQIHAQIIPNFFLTFPPAKKQGSSLIPFVRRLTQPLCLLLQSAVWTPGVKIGYRIPRGTFLPFLDRGDIFLSKGGN